MDTVYIIYCGGRVAGTAIRPEDTIDAVRYAASRGCTAIVVEIWRGAHCVGTHLNADIALDVDDLI